MIYVLDADILSLLAHKDSPEAPRIRRRIAQLPKDDSVVTTIVKYEEQMRGWLAALSRVKSREVEVQIYARILQHLTSFRRMTVLGFDMEAAAIAARLHRQKVAIGSMDLKIATITLAADGTLVTRNAVDFRKVPELRIEDWSIDTQT